MSVYDSMTINNDTRDLSDKNAVKFSEAQSLTSAQKSTARGNIGAGSSADVGTLSSLTTTAKGSLVAAVNELDAGKAEKDGTYPDLYAGKADNLVVIGKDGNVVPLMTEDKAPFLFRPSGGSADIGNREYDTVVGGTLAWNQLVGTGTTAVTIQSGRKYVACIGGTWTCAQSAGTAFAVTGGTDMVFDLTQMFGSAIANYAYGLEQATPGAGVAWFRKLFPKDYYAYDAGSLQSVQAASHNTVGFNQWDEEWEVGGINTTTGGNANYNDRIRSKNYIPVLPNTEYYMQVPIAGTEYCNWAWYDGSKQFISGANTQSRHLTSPSNARYLRFNVAAAYGATYNHDICINLSWSGYRNGEYEPYVKHSYALDDSLTLRGIPKLDTANNLYYDGDAYESDGTVTRKYGIVDLGTLEWTYQSQYTRFFTTGIEQSTFRPQNSEVANIICTKYSAHSLTGYTDKDISVSPSGTLFVKDFTYTDAAAFKTAMSGVYLVYELATPTTETADPFQSPQVVDDFGTEEYVDYPYSQGTRDVAVPVGHVTEYPSNLRDKIQHLPSPAANDGQYVIQQSGSQMALVADTSPGRLTALEEKVPDAPAADGTYVLKVTVADGEATYAWVAEN